MVIKLYVSNNSGNKTIKHHQEQIKLILDCKKVDYEEIDISAPDQEAEKNLMQEVCKKKEGQRVPLPPQVFNESEYLGDFDDFILANDDDEIWSFLKLEPQEPQPEAFTYTQERMNGYTNGHVNGDDNIVLNGQPTDWMNGLENGQAEEEIHGHVDMEPETVHEEIQESTEIQESIQDEIQESIQDEIQESIEDEIQESVEKVVETVEMEATEEQLVSDE